MSQTSTSPTVLKTSSTTCNLPDRHFGGSNCDLKRHSNSRIVRPPLILPIPCDGFDKYMTASQCSIENLNEEKPASVDLAMTSMKDKRNHVKGKRRSSKFLEHATPRNIDELTRQPDEMGNTPRRKRCARMSAPTKQVSPEPLAVKRRKANTMTVFSGQSGTSIASDDGSDVIFVSAKRLVHDSDERSDGMTENAVEIASQDPNDPAFLYDVLCGLAHTDHDFLYKLNLPLNLDGLDTWSPPSQPAPPGTTRIIAPVLLEDYWSLFVLDMETVQMRLFTARSDINSSSDPLLLVATKLARAVWPGQRRHDVMHVSTEPLAGDDTTHALTMLDVTIRIVLCPAETPIRLPTLVALNWHLCLKILYGGRRQNDELPGRWPRQELCNPSIEARIKYVNELSVFASYCQMRAVRVENARITFDDLISCSEQWTRSISASCIEYTTAINGFDNDKKQLDDLILTNETCTQLAPILVSLQAKLDRFGDLLQSQEALAHPAGVFARITANLRNIATSYTDRLRAAYVRADAKCKDEYSQIKKDKIRINQFLAEKQRFPTTSVEKLQERYGDKVATVWDLGRNIARNPSAPRELCNLWNEFTRVFEQKPEDWAEQFSFEAIRQMSIQERTNQSARVVCTTNDEILHLSKSGDLKDLTTGVGVLKVQHDRSAHQVRHDAMQFKRSLADSPESTVQCQNWKSFSRTTPVDMGKLLERMAADEAAKDKRRSKWSILNTLDWAGAMSSVGEPLVLQEMALGLLDRLVRRARFKHSASLGKEKQQDKRISDLESCLRFCLYGELGAVSGYHLDALNGTWVTNLQGLKGWFVYQGKWGDEEKEAFAKAGSSWEPPPEDVKMILLEEGDTLVMLGGQPIVHAVVTLEDSIMTGGMMWPETGVGKVLENLQYITKFANVTNEHIPRQLPEILDTLEELMAEESANTSAFPEGLLTFTEEDKSALAKLKDQLFQLFSCQCAQSCESGSCNCLSVDGQTREWGCTAWCHSDRHSERPYSPAAACWRLH